MKLRFLVLLIISVLFISLDTGASDAALRDLAPAVGRLIGAAVVAPELRVDTLYGQTIAREFNLMAIEDALKLDALRPQPDVYLFNDADYLVDFAQAHQMQVRGHTLLWHQYLPDWLANGNFTRDELLTILRDHITTVVSHYRGRIFAWDVVNEVLNEDGTLRPTLFLNTIGPEYIDLAFQWAHEADPNALLFINEYSAEETNAKSDGLYRLAESLLARGVPIHGIGLQSHLQVVLPLDTESLAANLERFEALGLQIHFTELDVRIQGAVGSNEELLTAQAEIYREITQLCLQSPACTALVTWGVTDRYSWIYRFTGNPDAPLMFDENYLPKPAYYAVADTLRAFAPPVVPTATPPEPTGVPEVRDLTISVVVDKPVVSPGDEVTFTISVLNTGNVPLTRLTLTDILPADMELVAAFPADGLSIEGTTVIFSHPILAASQPFIVSITVRIRSQASSSLVTHQVCASADSITSRCNQSDILSVSELPRTGETPWWSAAIRFIVGY